MVGSSVFPPMMEEAEWLVGVECSPRGALAGQRDSQPERWASSYKASSSGRSLRSTSQLGSRKEGKGGRADWLAKVVSGLLSTALEMAVMAVIDSRCRRNCSSCALVAWPLNERAEMSSARDLRRPSVCSPSRP